MGKTATDSDCHALAQILDLVADKWTIMVVRSLADGPRRFNEIISEIDGVSHRMLTLTLRRLAVNGLLTRTAYPVIPPKVVYELTELGSSLIEPLKALSGWAVEHRDTMEKHRIAAETDSAQTALRTR